MCCGPNLYEEVSFTCLVNRLNIIQVLLVQSVDSCHIPGFNTLAPCVKIIKKPARNGYRGQYSSSMCRSIWVSFQVLSNGAVQSQDASQAPAWPLKMDCSHRPCKSQSLLWEPAPSTPTSSLKNAGGHASRSAARTMATRSQPVESQQMPLLTLPPGTELQPCTSGSEYHAQPAMCSAFCHNES